MPHALIAGRVMVRILRFYFIILPWLYELGFGRTTPVYLMPQKLRFLILMLTGIIGLASSAHTVSPEEAQAVANKFFNSEDLNTPVKMSEIKALSKTNNVHSFYVFNTTNEHGFVIVSGDDRVPRILGYSDQGAFDADNVPPQLTELLEQYAVQINNIPDGTPVHESWKLPAHASEGSGVLLETANWGQGEPYNMLTPEFDGVHAPTGCVATAMAIVMKYHNWPERGRHKFEFERYGENLYHDFSTDEFDFTKMPNDCLNNPTESQVCEISKLMYCASFSVATSFSKKSGSARSEIVGHQLMRYFKYSPDCQHIELRDFDKERWTDIIKENLDSKAPIIYFANSESEGHAFILDGYNGEGMYHINWGWNGSANGYFNLLNLSPLDFSFNNNHRMVVNIIPDRTNTDYAEPWCCIGLFREMDQSPTAGMNDGLGVMLSCCDIVPNQPFNLKCECIASDLYGWNGNIGVAVVNDKNEIIELLDQREVGIHMFPGDDVFPMFNCTECYDWPDLIYHGKIDNSYRIQMVAQNENDSIWKIMTGTLTTPSHCPLSGNTPNVISFNWTIHDDGNNIMFQESDKAKLYRLGQAPWPHIMVRNGAARMVIDGGAVYDETWGRDVVGISYFASKLSYDIVVDFYPYTEINKTIYLHSGNPLEGALSSEDRTTLASLKIIGKIKDSDLKALENLHVLRALDLSECDMSQCQSSQNSINTDIVLYPTISGQTIINAKHYLRIPKGAYKDDLHIKQIPYVVELEDDNPRLTPSDIFGKDANCIYIVPLGSECLYRNMSYWLEKDMIEASGNAIPYFKYDTTVTESIMIGKDQLLLRQSFCDGGNATFKDFYGGYDHTKKFHTKYRQIPKNDNGGKIIINFDTEWEDLPKFDGSGSKRPLYFFPEGCIHGSQINATDKCWCDWAFVSNLKTTLNNICVKELYIPDGYDIENNIDDIKNITSRSVKMFSYKKHRKHNVISVKPELDFIQIESVLINGTYVNGIDGFYSIPNEGDYTVEINYIWNDRVEMTTFYDAEYNYKMPESELDDSIYSISINDSDYVTAYSLTGIIVFSGRQSDIFHSLKSGVYIVKKENGQVFKVVL